MGFLNIFTSPDKVIAEAGQTLRQGLSVVDEAFYTDQEKLEGRTRIYELYNKALETSLGNNSIRSKARRELARLVAVSFFGSGWLAVVIFPLNKYFPHVVTAEGQISVGYSGFLWQWVDLQLPLMMTVMGFYFTLYCLDKGVEIAKTLRGGK